MSCLASRNAATAARRGGIQSKNKALRQGQVRFGDGMPGSDVSDGVLPGKPPGWLGPVVPKQ